MKRFLWIGVCLILLTVIWAGAQEKKGLKPAPPIPPVPEKEKPIEKLQLRPVEGVPAVPESAKGLEKGQLRLIERIPAVPEVGKQLEKRPLSPMEKVTALIEERDELKKRALSSSEQVPSIPESGIGFEGKLRLKDSSPVPVFQEVLPQYGPKTLKQLPGVPILEESVPQYSPTALKQLPDVAVLEEPPIQYVPSGLREMNPIQPVDGIAYQVQEFSDFRGGLNLASVKTKLAPNEALVLENALWNEAGEMYKRPGYSEHSTPPETFNFLYRYYQQDGDKWTMGGSDTALYFWHEDSSGDGWTYLTGTEGVSGRWDGTTFEDMFVATHEGITPIVWDGSTFVEMGSSVDSLLIANYDLNNCSNLDTNSCTACSVTVSFEENMGWTENEWAGYVLEYKGATPGDTVLCGNIMRKDIIVGNNDHEVYIRASLSMWLDGYFPNIKGQKARILSHFQSSLWREGQIDSVVRHSDHLLKMFDSDYTWDAICYWPYVFEAVSGKGTGFRAFLGNQRYGCPPEAFSLASFTRHCFDSTTHYKIYTLSFWEGSKFVETFDGSLFLGWTGTGDEQNKNTVIWSALGDLGNWLPENHIIIESDDGDYITGMAKFPGEYTDVPRQEMIVTKNNSFYKIVPTSDGYNFWLVQSGVGCVSNSAISPAEGLLLFPDQHGVWAYDKIKPTCISSKIDPIFEDWDLYNLEDVSAIYNPQDRHYYLSLAGSYLPDSGVLLENFEDTSEWDYDQVDGTIAEDTTYYREGNKSLKLSVTNGGEVYAWKNMTADWLGLTNLSISVYVSDWEKINLIALYGLKAGEDYMYVNFTEDARAFKTGWNKYVVPISAFEEHGTVTWADVISFEVKLKATTGESAYACFDDLRYGYNLNGKAKMLISFDDGWISQYIKAKPILDGNKQKSTAFIVSDWVGTEGYMTLEQLRELQNSGWDISNHSKSHQMLDEISQEEMENEIDVAYDWLVANGFSESAHFFSYPGAMPNYNDSVLAKVRERHKLAWSSHRIQFQAFPKINDDNQDLIIKGIGIYDYTTIETIEGYIDDAIDAHGLLLFYFHKIADSPGGEALKCSTAIFQQMSDYLKTKSDVGLIDVINFSDLYEFISPKPSYAWNVDFGGWSKQSFPASAYCYQHSITDDVKILFAGSEDTKVYNYGTQADDIDEPVILTYQTPYKNFGQYPSFNYEMRYATVEAFLDTGNIYLTWYKNYSDLTYYDSLICGSDCRQEMVLPEDLWGKNISMKLRTGSNVDNFTLSRFWWEWTEDQNRK